MKMSRIAIALILFGLVATVEAGSSDRCESRKACCRNGVTFPRAADPIWAAKRGIPTGDAPLLGRPIFYPMACCNVGKTMDK